MQQAFRALLFSRIVPCVKDIGLWGERFDGLTPTSAAPRPLTCLRGPAIRNEPKKKKKKKKKFSAE